MQEEKNLIYNIRWLREKHGLTRRKMAHMLSISLLDIFLLEHGIIPVWIGIDMLFCIHRHFDVSITELFRKHLDES